MNWLVVLKMIFCANTLEILIVWFFGFGCVLLTLPDLCSFLEGPSDFDLLDSLLLDLLDGAFSIDSFCC